jgi:hypothetical protein
MRTLLADQFEKIARSVVDQFMHANDKKASLDGFIIKAAQDMELTPEQTRTLVQGANAMAHLALADQKTDGDRYVEFSPTDPDLVLRKMYVETDTPESVRTAEDRVSDFLGATPVKDQVYTENPTESCSAVPAKTASAEEPTDPARVRREALRSARTLRKVAEELRTRKYEAAQDYGVNLEKLATELNRTNAVSPDEFEKDAVSVFGDVGQVMSVQALAVAHLPRSKTAAEEVANAVRMVDTDAPHMTYLQAMVTAREKFATCNTSLEEIEEQLVPFAGLI